MSEKHIHSLTLHSLSQQDQEDWTGSDDVWLRVFADGKETVSDKRKPACWTGLVACGLGSGSGSCVGCSGLRAVPQLAQRAEP